MAIQMHGHNGLTWKQCYALDLESFLEMGSCAEDLIPMQRYSELELLRGTRAWRL